MTRPAYEMAFGVHVDSESPGLWTYSVFIDGFLRADGVGMRFEDVLAVFTRFMNDLAASRA
jgi:hypothetical protein